MKWERFFGVIVLINFLLIALRFSVGDPKYFTGNTFSAFIFLIVFSLLSLTFLKRQHERFLLVWLSFYYASPIVVIPSFPIGSLGLINAIFIPLMLYRTFNPKSKYYLLIVALIVLSLLSAAGAPISLILSRVLYFIIPIFFFYYTYKLTKRPISILYGSILVAGINLVLPLFQAIFIPDWGVTWDWRGYRITGNLFHPNDYAMYLFAPFITAYHFFRKKESASGLLITVVLFIPFWFALSRIAILSLFTAILCYEFLMRGLLKITFKKILLIFSIFIISIVAYQLQDVDSHFQAETLQERTVIWESVLSQVGNLIIGNGVGSYELYRADIVNALSPHNAFLEMVFEIGGLGLFVVLLYLFFMLKDSYPRVKESMSDSLPIIATITYILVFSMTDGAAFNQAISLNAWISMGAFMKLLRGKQHD